MYRTAGPTIGARSKPFPLGLARIVHRRFGGGTSRVDDAFSVRHFSDLTTGHGVAYRGDIAARSAGNTFTAMATELIDAVSPDDGPIELVIVAHATPDLDCRLAATTYLSDALPGCSLVFAVTDGGAATPYTALRLAGHYADRHGYRCVLVLLMDQATLPYDIPAESMLAGDAAVGILLKRTSPTGLAFTQSTEVLPEDLPAAVGTTLAAMTTPGEAIAVIAGAGLDPDRDLPECDDVIWCAPNGFPCTATWEGLARQIGACATGRIVLVDYDRRTLDLSVCAVHQPWVAQAMRNTA
jgi:hypothetical protein